MPIRRYALLCCIFFAVAAMPAQFGADSGEFVKSNSTLSILNLDALARSYDPSSVRAFVPASDIDGDHLKSGYIDGETRAFEQYQSDRAATDEMLAGGTKAAKIMFSLAETAAGGTEIHALEFATKGGSTFFDVLTDKFENERNAAGIEAAKAFYDSRKFDPSALERAQRSGVDSYITEVRRQAGASLSTIDALKPEERTYALSRLGDFAIAASADNAIQISQFKQVTADKFRQLDGRFNALDKRQDAIMGRLTSLANDTRQNTEDIATLSKEIQQQHGDLSVVEDVLYRQSGPEDKIQILKIKGALGLTDAQRSKLTETLKKQEEIVADARKWNDFICTGRDAIGVLKAFNVDPQLIANLQQTVGRADVLYKGVSAALSGNYLQAIAGVAGLFGAVGESPDAARHQEIMRALSAIIENQRKIMEALNGISKMMEAYHRDIVARLDSIYALQGATLQAVIASATSRMNDCVKFADSRMINGDSKGPYFYSGRTGQFASYSYMVQHFRNNSPNYGNCRAFLDQILTLSPTNFGIIGIPAIEAGRIDSELDPAIREPYKKTVLPYLTYLDTFVDNRQATIAAFLYPAGNFQTLTSKVESLKSADVRDTLEKIRPVSSNAFQEGDARNHFFLDYFPSFVSPESLVKYVQAEVDINRYIELVNPSDRTMLLSQHDLLSVPPPSAEAIMRLRSARDWLDLAITQQTCISGDLLLNYLADDLFATDKGAKLDFFGTKADPKDTDWASKRASLGKMMVGRNPLLFGNVLRFRLYRTMQQKRLSSFAYSVAWNMSSDPFYIRQFFEDAPPIEYKVNPQDDLGRILPSGWYFDYAYKENIDSPVDRVIKLVPIPTPDEVNRRTFLVPYALEQLRNARNEVNKLLLQYQLVESAKRNANYKAIKLILISARNPNATMR